MCSGIAIVGMACEYPDASSPVELWENSLAKRRSFRVIPKERLNLNDYYSIDKTKVDKTYSRKAAVIKNYEFDRVKYKTSGNTYRNTDLTHWLSLDVATRALEDAGFIEGNGLPKETTGVIVGNTLTGEFSRANVMRLRWPYVQRVLESTFSKNTFINNEKLEEVLLKIKKEYLKSFPEFTEDSLAGGLSNTIAGRICNYYDFKGGGYTIDGACSSSLLAITKACSSLENYELDAAIVGGVDLSIDPFEIIGFAKNGALARDEMLVYDKSSNGFWPGEGCGFVVLMREEDAFANNLNPYAVIKGWGISSDGKGGITRPEVSGQLLALERTYQKAGYNLDSVSYVEGHGTGTKIGDDTEIRTLLELKKHLNNVTYISSIKANIGHTKAAAGIAGLLKTVMGVKYQIIPPATGCVTPHTLLDSNESLIKITSKPLAWPKEMPLRASVSAMGFGGINAHITLERESDVRRVKLSRQERKLILSNLKQEVFLLNEDSKEKLKEKIQYLITETKKISQSEFTDLSVYTQKKSKNQSNFKLAIIAVSLEDLQNKLQISIEKIGTEQNFLDAEKGIYYSDQGSISGKIAFAFPGQGSPITNKIGFISSFLPSLVLEKIDHSTFEYAKTNTEIAQPLITKIGVQGIKLLNEFGVKADFALGHSLGELTALYWGGALTEKALDHLAKIRGKLMHSTEKGVMASADASISEIKRLLNTHSFDIAAINSQNQIVISGHHEEINKVVDILESKRFKCNFLKVTRAFHSSLMNKIVEDFKKNLVNIEVLTLDRSVLSTVSGQFYDKKSDIKHQLVRQLTEPVLFKKAVTNLENKVDLFIEVGAGSTLTGIVGQITNKPSIPLNLGDTTGHYILNVLAASFVLGKKIKWELLYNKRFYREYSEEKNFFLNPCEQVQQSIQNVQELTKEQIIKEEKAVTSIKKGLESDQIIKDIISKKTELPIETIKDSSKMLDDLHLNSISVSQIVIEIAKKLNISPPISPTDFANATVEEINDFFQNQPYNLPIEAKDEYSGVDTWVKPFIINWKQKKLNKRKIVKGDGKWSVISNSSLSDKMQNVLNNQKIGNGILLHLEEDIDFILLEQALEELKKNKNLGRFVIIQSGEGIKSFGKTLYLESPNITVCLIKAKLTSKNLTLIVDEIAASEGFIEVKYTENHIRQLPYMEIVEYSKKERPLTLQEKDVVLVTGGGKGIGAACAKALVKLTGSKIAILGRSNPSHNKELEKNLSELLKRKIEFLYVSVDITKPNAVKQAIKDIENKIGKITGIIHAAGINNPKTIAQLTMHDIKETIGPKVKGLENILQYTNHKILKFMVSFGSIIGTSGMHGDAHYGIANELLRKKTIDFANGNPNCKSLCFEWSVWAGAGMGEKIGTLDQLKRKGITPINLDHGIDVFLELFQSKVNYSNVIVSSRIGSLPTIQFDKKNNEVLGRFLEKKLIEFPGVELITEIHLHPDTDLYLSDHELNKEKIFPAVMSIEAMSQVASSISGNREQIPIIKNLSFKQPIIVDETGTKIRISGLSIGKNLVKVVIQSEKTDYLVDHVVGICHFVKDNGVKEIAHQDDLHLIKDYHPKPSEHLYNHILFQKGRFQNIEDYHYLTATKSIALVRNESYSKWFGNFLPEGLITKTVGSRDSILHSLQASFPYKHLIPVSVKEVRISKEIENYKILKVLGIEKERSNDFIIYDIQVSSLDGVLLETWKSLTLKPVGREIDMKEWNPYLFGPYLERKINELDRKMDLRVFLDYSEFSKDKGTYSKQIVTKNAEIYRRIDDKPETNVCHVSCSNLDNYHFAVSSLKDVGCDIEKVQQLQSELWESMLGKKYYKLANWFSKYFNEDLDISCTRAWTILESIKKVGKLHNHPISIDIINDRFIILNSGSLCIISTLIKIEDIKEPVVLTVAAEGSV